MDMLVNFRAGSTKAYGLQGKKALRRSKMSKKRPKKHELKGLSLKFFGSANEIHVRDHSNKT